MLSKESYVKELNLGYLERRLVQVKKWPDAKAKEAVRRYKNFLILIIRYPNEMLAPAPDMDEAWHNHILYTKEYIRDSNAIFGGYLHHEPADPNAKERMRSAQDISSHLYYKEFKEPYHLEIDVSSFW